MAEPDEGAIGNRWPDRPDYLGASVFDFDSFSEWLEHTASSTGKSQTEILEGLIAANWRLNELIIEDDDAAPMADADSIAGSQGGGQFGPPTDDAYVDLVSELAEVRSEVRELRELATSTRERSPDPETIRCLQEVLDRHDDLISDGQSEARGIADVDAAVSRVQERTDSLAGIQEDLRARQTALREDHSGLRDYVTREFSNAREILAYLVESTDEHDASIESIRASHRSRVQEYRQLIDLKDAAIAMGIESASCEQCDLAIDVGRLANTECPDCGSRFEDIEREKTWFGLSESYKLCTTAQS